MSTILPKSKTHNVSLYDLKASAFDVVNYRPAGAPPNDTLTADTPKGVLGGAVATGSADWEANLADHTAVNILGLFADNSEGNAFENAPAAASGKVAIYAGNGFFDVYLFETYAQDTPYASILGNYTINAPLYSGYFGLLTPTQPTTMTTGGGVNTIIGYISKVPVAADLKLGIRLVQ